MKKILFVICCTLGIVACASGELPLPETQSGVFLGNPTYDQAESILYDSCARARWQIVNKGQGFMSINFDRGDFNFSADIQFTNLKYAIIFRRVNRDDGSKKEAYNVYRKYALKLSRVIQKVSAKNR